MVKKEGEVKNNQIHSSKHKHNIAIVVLAVVVIALLAGSLYYYQKSRIAQVSPDTSENCGVIDNTYTKDSCYLQVALNKNSEQVCASISDADLKDLCYIKISKMQRDKTICENIGDKYYSEPKCYIELKAMGVN